MRKIFLAALVASAAFAQGPCDRACLEGFVNQYLEALVAHDPTRLQMTPDVKFTEDDIALKPGEALWKTASGLGTYKLYFADPPGWAGRLLSPSAKTAGRRSSCG